MAGPTVSLAFAGDSTSLEKTFAKVGSSAKNMATDLDKAETKTKSFGSALDTAGGAADASESKFMGAADVLDGLGSAFGLPTEGATGMMRAFGDLSGGFATLQPMIGTVSSAIQSGLGGALSFIAAHPVLITIGLLAAAFVLLWKNSETFRDIVRGVIDKVGSAFSGLWNGIKSAASAITDVLIGPFKMAFNTIAKLWNNTVGKLSFEVPSWVPGIGGNGFSMPRLPEFHSGGVIPGTPGTPMPIMALAGETIVPAGQAAAGGGGPQTIVLQVDGRELARVVTDQQRGNTARGFR